MGHHEAIMRGCGRDHVHLATLRTYKVWYPKVAVYVFYFANNVKHANNMMATTTCAQCLFDSYV